MLIEKLILPNAEEEDIALLNGAAIIGMPKNCQNFLPFGVFPPKCLKEIGLGDITIFAGGLSSARTMLDRVLHAKLSEDYLALYKMSDDTLCEFCKLCELKYGANIRENDFDFLYIDKESIHKFAEKKYSRYEDDIKWSVLDRFELLREADCFVMIETPEDYMSFYELCIFAEELEVLTSNYTCQIVLITNSPVLLGINNAVIYDFDSEPILPYTWHNSPLIKEYKKYHNYMVESHTYNKKK